MPLSFPSGFSSSTKTPTIALQVNLGASSRSAGRAPKRLLLLGNKTASGTATDNVVVQVYSEDDARGYFGAGSELFLMCQAAFRQHRRATLYACPVPQGGGAVAALGTVVVAGTPSAAGVARVWIAGDLFEVAVATTDTATTVAAALAAKINQATDLLCTAAAAIGTVTLTSKNAGTRGNNTTLRGQVTATGMTLALSGGSAAANPLPTKFGTGSGGATAGSVADDITNALAAAASQQFHRIAVAHDDATNITRLRTHCNTYSAATERKRCQGEAASVAALATAKTLATGQNAARVRVDWHYLADDTTGQVAAQGAAAKLWGDGAVGGGIGKAKGEEAYAAANMNGCMLASVRAQAAIDDQPLGTEVEDALNNGLTPLVPAAANPGFCAIAKSVTSRSVDSASNPNYAVHDVAKVTVADHVAETVEARTAAEFPNKNIAPDPTDGSGPTHPDVIFPSMLKAFIGSQLEQMQRDGLLVKVAENMPLLTVEQDSTNPSVALVEIPVSVIDHFHSLLGQVSQIG